MTGRLQTWARDASRDDLIAELIRMDAKLAQGMDPAILEALDTLEHATWVRLYEAGLLRGAR